MVHHHSAGCASVAIGKAGRPLIVQGFRRRRLRRQGIGSGNACNEEKRSRPIAGGVPNRFSLVSVAVVMTGVDKLNEGGKVIPTFQGEGRGGGRGCPENQARNGGRRSAGAEGRARSGGGRSAGAEGQAGRGDMIEVTR